MTDLQDHPAALQARNLAPGVAAIVAIAALATALHRVPGVNILSPLILATAAGMAVRNIFGPIAALSPGQTFVLKRILRLAIIMLGFQISLGQIVGLGLHGVVVVLIATPATFLLTVAVGRWLKLDSRFCTLIAAGTSICGASAIVATNSVVDADEEDVAYAIASITLFGTVAMFAYPALAPLLGLRDAAFGLWSGASIHEVAQAVGAAFQGGEAAGKAGVVAKLLRVALLGPLIMFLALRQRSGDKRAPIPWYLFGFVGVILLNSVAPPPEAVSKALQLTTTFLMTMALAAMGLGSDLRALKRRGLRPLALGAIASLFMCGLVLALVWLAL